MNRRQFIAGLMASTVAPALPVPIMKPRSLGMSYGPSQIFDLFCEYEWARRQVESVAGIPAAFLTSYVGEYRGIVIREIDAKDLYAP
jgi:hypothetical protein